MKAAVQLNEARQKLWMSSSTIVPAHHTGRLYASISSMNHAHYTLRLVRFFYILWRDSWVIFLFMKNSLRWHPSTCIKNDYKIGLLGELWADVWFALQRSLFFFVYCVIQGTVDRAPRRYLYTRMRLRLWLSKMRMVNQFTLATFSKSVILRRHVAKF